MTEQEMVRLVKAGFAGIITVSCGPSVRLARGGHGSATVVIRRDLPKLPVTAKEGK